MSALRLQSEPTEVGEQCLVPGVRPISARARLEARMAGPLVPQRPQKALDIGLFDEAALNQLELFGPGGRIATVTHELPPGGG